MNIVDHYVFETEKTLLPLARELNVGIIAMKPLAGGLLKDASRALRFALAQEADVVIPGWGVRGRWRRRWRWGRPTDPYPRWR